MVVLYTGKAGRKDDFQTGQQLPRACGECTVCSSVRMQGDSPDGRKQRGRQYPYHMSCVLYVKVLPKRHPAFGSREKRQKRAISDREDDGTARSEIR